MSDTDSANWLDMSALSKIPTWILVLVPTVYAYYKYATWNYDTFKKLGIKGPRPWPIIGTSYTFMTKGLVANDIEMRRHGKVVGTFLGRTPVLIIYDVDILKQILIKEFRSFTNKFVPPIMDYPIDKMLIMLKGDHWRHVRNIMTPTFSSGKLRKMNDQIQDCSKTFVRNLLEKTESNESFDFRAVCGAYTMDVIASTAFSVKIDSHNDPNNQFVQMAQKAFKSIASPKVLVLFFMPFLMRPLAMLGFRIFPEDVTSFFVNVVNQALDQRKQTESTGEGKQVDFLQLMSDAHLDDDGTSDERKSHRDASEANESEKSEASKEKGLTHDEILAQSMLFFFGGFESVANTLSLLGYNLARNPEAQEKLLKEIDDVMKDKDRVDYDVVKDMPYLDMCISETLRLYPAAVRTDRVATNECTINGLFIPKDMVIISPIYVLHMDPEIWPNPTKFIPERFTPEEKAARNPYYYMPFGVGPRNCVGMRLALTELKISAVHILRKMKFMDSPETEVKL